MGNGSLISSMVYVIGYQRTSRILLTLVWGTRMTMSLTHYKGRMDWFVTIPSCYLSACCHKDLVYSIFCSLHKPLSGQWNRLPFTGTRGCDKKQSPDRNIIYRKGKNQSGSLLSPQANWFDSIGVGHRDPEPALHWDLERDSKFI